MKPKDEESFPRSSKNLLESERLQKQYQTIHIPEDEQLFKSRKRRSSEFGNNENKNKKKKKTQNQPDSNEENLKKTIVENLSFNRLIESMIVLGCLQEITDFELKFSITGGIIVTVPITNISSPYTKALECFANNNDCQQNDVKEVPKLSSIFNVGDYYAVKILFKETSDKFGHSEIIGSINPKDIYQNYNVKTFTKLPKGYNLIVAVSSKEDHGYLMDIGSDEMKAFLPIRDLEENSHNTDLKIGQLIQCSIDQSHERSLLLTVHKKLSNFILQDDHKPNILFYFPGINTQGIITNLQNSGLELDLPGGYKGFVPRYHVNEDLSISPKQLKIGDKIQGHVLYVHPHTKQVCVSLKNKLSKKKIKNLLDTIKIGSILPKVTVCAHSLFGNVIFKTPNNCFAIALKKNLIEPKENDEEIPNNIYTINSSHIGRVKNFNLFDNLIELSLRKSFVESKDITLDDIQIGSILEGTVKKYKSDGIYLKLGFGINGFMPKIHFIDAPIINYEKIRDKFFPINQKVHCRVLRLDGGYRTPKITLTSKKTLLNMKDNEIFKDLNEIKPGMFSTGVVCLISDRGILLEFFNRVCGFIPLRYLAAYKIEHPDKVFQLGQLVKCTVVSVDLKSQTMVCSLIDLDETKKLESNLQIKNKKYSMNSKLKVGQILKKMKIISKIPMKGFDLTNPQEKVEVFLPISQLSDDPFICLLLFSSFKIDDIIDEVMVFSKDAANVICVTRKSVFLKQNYQFITSEEDIIINSPFPAIVRNITPTGVFFETPNLQYGVIRKKYLQDGFYDEPHKLGLCRGQTLFINPFDISSFEQTNCDANYLKRFKFSMKLSHVLNKNENIGIEILKTFLNEFDFGKSLLSKSTEDASIKKLSSYSIGQAVTYVITEITEDQVKANISLTGSKNEPTVIGIANIKKKSHNLGISQMGNAIVCDIDFERKQLIIFLQSQPAKLVRQAKSFQKNNLKKIKINQIIKGTVIHSNDKYVLAIMGGHVPGLLAFIPTKKHYNDLRHIEKLFTIGQSYHFSVEYFDEDNINDFNQKSVKVLMTLNESAKKSTIITPTPTSEQKKESKALTKSNESIVETIDNNNEEIVKPDDTVQIEEKVQLSPKITNNKRSIIEKFDWDVVDLSKLNNKRKLDDLKKSGDECDEDFYLESDSDEDDNDDLNRKRKSREERNDETRRREQLLRQKENQLTDVDRTPKDEQDFEMAVIASPNSSLVWIKYMAFHLERKELDKAREVGERALRKISFREEKERINIWVSLLNLENNYGDENSMQEMLEKAIKFNDAKTIYSRLAIIYNDSNKKEKAEQIYNTMIKKFYSDESVWIDFILFYFKNGQIDSARQLFRKSLHSVDKRHHVDLISKFAQMEFRYGDSEQGKTIFESLLATYWKRLDKWSIYIDMLIKYTLKDDHSDDDQNTEDNIDSLEFIRNIFERLLTFKFSPHKMKFIFKKYYDFESKYSADNVEILEQLKQKACEYVENGIF